MLGQCNNTTRCCCRGVCYCSDLLYRCWSDLFFVFLLAWTDAKWTPPSRFYPDSSHLPIVSFDDGPCVVSSRSISCLADVRLVFIRLLYNTLASTTRIPPPKDKWKGWMAIEIERKHDDWRFIQPSAHQAVCYVNSSRLTHSLFFLFLFDITNNLVVPAVLCDVANMASSNGAIRKRVADARMWMTRPWGLLR